MQQATQRMSFLLPKHVIKPGLLEYWKYCISNLTAKQLPLGATESILRLETCKHSAEETHALLPLSSEEAGAWVGILRAGAVLSPALRVVFSCTPCFNSEVTILPS